MFHLDSKPNVSDYQEAEMLISLTQGLSSVSLTTSGASNAVELSYSSSSTVPKSVKDYECPFLEALPVETRYTIYALFLPSRNHHIELTLPIEPREPLVRTFKSLMLTCKKTGGEVKDWYKGLKNQYGFVETKQYGPINLDQTIFSINVAKNLVGFGCTQCSSVYRRPCFSNGCAKSVHNRICDLFNLEHPFYAIHHLQVSIGRDSEDGYLDQLKLMIIYFAKKMWNLQELDVFLCWGLSCQQFVEFLDGYAESEWCSQDVSIPVRYNPRTVEPWTGEHWSPARCPKCQVTVWHGPEMGDAATASVLKSPMQKLVSWLVTPSRYY